MNRTKFRRLLTAAIVAFILITFCLSASYYGFMQWYYAPDIEARHRYIASQQLVPTVQVRFSEVYNEVLTITDDDSLGRFFVEPLHAPSGLYSVCVRGLIEAAFGANRPYSEVIAEYTDALRKMGWERPNSSVPGPNLLHIVGFNTLKARVMIFGNVTSVAYQTIYRVRITYAEPSYSSCYG